MNAATLKPFRVLFVCMGNICRSPAAEIIFRKLVADAGRSAEFEIDSAGSHGYHQGDPPDSRMGACLARNGYPVTGRARKIKTDDLKDFDLIVTMDEDNLAAVNALDRDGWFRSKIRPLVEFCREHQAPRVPDPYYGGQRGFDQVIELLEDGCAGILRELPAAKLTD
ncbi:MAG: low molecular weight phosphotyrosine protein phosphatase [Verrucomicrobia bacterium]|nr:low molecular weight phosphotyrosine protein phosphatase [Verrucomicrobiota bacterium]